MRIILIAVVVFLIANHSLHGQRLVLESKAGFSMSAYIALPLGKSETSNGSFTFPSLLSNFKQGYGFDAEYYRQFNPRINVGISYSTVFFSDWQFNPTSEAFTHAEASIQSISLKVSVKSFFHERGVLNKMKLYAGLAPGAYVVAVEAPEQSISSTRTLRPGLQTNGKIEYAIRNSVGISISGDYQLVSVESVMYQEKIFQWLQVSVGITFRLNKNQNYLRTPYE